MTEDRIFSIILVDDHYENLDKQIDEIDAFLNSLGFKLDILKSKKGDEVVEWMTQKQIDILITDKNLGSKKGEEVIADVRRRNFLCDILYYSGVSIDDKDFVDLGKFFSVEVIREREFVPPMKKMITKNLSKWDDVIFLRGIVLSQTINLETKINEFYSKYFRVAEDTLQHFDLIMEGTVNTFEGKRQALAKIIEINEWKEYDSIATDIKHVQEERNIIAHCKFDDALRVFIKRGEPKKYDVPKMKSILSSVESSSAKLEELMEKLSSGTLVKKSG